VTPIKTFNIFMIMSLVTIQIVFANVPIVKQYSYKFYGVVFGIVIDKNGDLHNLRIVKVLDPACKGCDLSDMKVSQEFFDNVQQHVRTKGYKPEIENGIAKEFYTYFIYDPMRPERIDLDPNNESNTTKK